MGLLNKIRNEHDTHDAKTLSGPAVLDGTTLDGKPVEPAVPCSCGCPTFWRSAYGGPLRCAVCEPWPSLAMVGERWTIWMRPDATLAWTRAIRPGERASVPAAVLDGLATDADRDDGIRWANVDDEEGEWLVIWKAR